MYILRRPESLHVHVPAYNSARHIGDAIDTVLSDLELSGVDGRIIVADDVSTDNTLEVLNQYRGNPRVTVLNNPKNLGVGANHKSLLEYSMGLDVPPLAIAFRDNDDVSIAGSMALLLAELDEFGLVGGNQLEFRDGNPDTTTEQTRVDDYEAMKQNILRGHLAVWNPTSVMRADILEPSRYPTVRFCDDLLFQAQLLAREVPIKHLDIPVIKYRRHDGSVTTGFHPSNAAYYLSACIRVWNTMGVRPSKEDVAFVAARTLVYAGLSSESSTNEKIRRIYRDVFSIAKSDGGSDYEPE